MSDYEYHKWRNTNRTEAPAEKIPQYIKPSDLTAINRALHQGRDVRIQRQSTGVRIVSDEISILLKRSYEAVSE